MNLPDKLPAKLPCRVILPVDNGLGGVVIGKGCALSTLHMALSNRADWLALKAEMAPQQLRREQEAAAIMESMLPVRFSPRERIGSEIADWFANVGALDFEPDQRVLTERVMAALPHAWGYEGPKEITWEEAQEVADDALVHDLLQGFSEDPTGDNGTMLVQAIMGVVKRGQ